MRASNRSMAGALAAGALTVVAALTATHAAGSPPTPESPASESTASESASAPAADQIVVPHASMWSGPPLLGAADSGSPGDGMRVAIDGRGRIVAPSARQTRELDAAIRRDQAERGGRVRAFSATQVESADGTVMAQLDPDLMSYSVVVLDADGVAHHVCVDGETASEHAHTVAPAVLAEEK